MILLALAVAAASPQPLVLSFPLACRLGSDCAIQNYPDEDPGAGVRDHACGERSYDRHDGTDIRLPSMVEQRRGVAVLAAATGTVRAIRDGMADVSARARAFEPGKDCGNGIVVDHPGGWQTQYCHMAQGSIAVRPGQPVAAGATLGKVGLSGNTEFPHLHLTVREGGTAVDPFAWRAAGRCGGGRSLWQVALPYRRGELLLTGFAGGAVTPAQVQEQGSGAGERPSRALPLVAWAEAIGLEAGDIQRITLHAPDGATLADNVISPLDRGKAQYLLFTGRNAPAGGWPKGRYLAEYELRRGAKIVIARSFGIEL